MQTNAVKQETGTWRTGYELEWKMVAALAALDAAWLLFFSHLRIDLPSLAVVLGGCGGMMGLAWFYAQSGSKTRIVGLLHSISVLLAYSGAAAAFSFLVASLRFPLQDAQLVAMDRMLGFDWPSMYAWLNGRPMLLTLLRGAYSSPTLLVMLLLAIHNYQGNTGRSREIIRLFILSSLMCILLSGPFPAAGAFPTFGVNLNDPYVQQFRGVREGTLQVINLGQVQGIVQFPSFHTALAIVLAYAARGLGGFFLFSVVLNSLVILSTPAVGGHHLADLLGGTVLAMLAIFVERRVAWGRSRRE